MSASGWQVGISVALFLVGFAATGVSRLQRWQPPLMLLFAAWYFAHRDPAAPLESALVGGVAACALTGWVRRPVPTLLRRLEALAAWSLWLVFVQQGVHRIVAVDPQRGDVAVIAVALLLLAAALRLAWRFVEFTRLVLSEH